MRAEAPEAPVARVGGVDGVKVDNVVGRDAVLAVAPSRFELEVDLWEPAILAFGISMDPSVWADKARSGGSDGVTFIVDVVDGNRMDRLFESTVDATHGLTARRWFGLPDRPVRVRGAESHVEVLDGRPGERRRRPRALGNAVRRLAGVAVAWIRGAPARTIRARRLPLRQTTGAAEPMRMIRAGDRQ